MENKTFKALYSLNHSSIENVHFSKNSSDFVVRELPLYDFSGEGEHLILHIQKKDLTTFEAIKILSAATGIKQREFGYAGLKDKQGMTLQYLSLPRKAEASLENFKDEKMKILSKTYHNNKIRVGHLKGNNFYIRLKKVLPTDAQKITNALQALDKNGFPNYFGYQRFGKFGDNALQGEQILKGELKIKNPKMSNFLISAYQSELFNKWLSKRIEISKFAQEFKLDEFCKIYNIDKNLGKSLQKQEQFFKLLPEEVLGHYPFGKVFLCEDLEKEVERFQRRDLTSCGLIFGKKAFEAQAFAKVVEDEIFSSAYQYLDKVEGSRRFAWCYLNELSYNYKEEAAQFSISFSLPKASYATVVLEEILHRNILE